jgi:hypothetical protein
MRPNPFRRVALGLSLLLAAPAFGAESHLLGGVLLLQHAALKVPHGLLVGFS